MADLTPSEVPIEQLLLDPNNYRFLDAPDFRWAEDTRFHEPSVQDAAYRRLRADGTLQALKNSILSNGFLPIERLVVRPYEHQKDSFLVLEGNRRLAALRWIAEDDAAGVAVPEGVRQAIKEIPIVIIAEREPELEAALLGVRHVSGIRDWGPYQRARIVAQLRDEHGLDGANIAARLGMSPQETNRRYRAYKALEQMQGDEVFGDYATPALYPMFHEVVSQPAIRDEWLGWDETTHRFTNDTERDQLYDLITPRTTEDGDEQPPKITRSDEMRTLKEILPIPEARGVLLDPASTLLDAELVVKRDQISRAWASQVNDAITALDTIEKKEVKGFTEEDIANLERLRDLAIEVLDDHRRLTAT